jgi:myo-inositol-1(or 4)-monophosphatase
VGGRPAIVIDVELPAGRSGKDAIAVARGAAEEAVGLIRDHFRNVTITAKGNRNVVTDADIAVERAVTALLRREFPEHALLSEEEAAEGWSDEWMWVCDPIDGTKNFSQGIPHFGFSLALCHGGMPVLGLTVHPLLGWEVLAVRGQGCTFNGMPARVSQKRSIGESVVAIDLGYDSEAGRRQLELARAIWPAPQAVRIAGSATLGFAYAATGTWEVYTHADLNPWDIAAGIVLVEEAGGVITARDGGPAALQTRAAVAGAAGVHAEILDVVRQLEQGA